MGQNALVPRDIYSPPPQFRPTFLDRPTLLVTYWCCIGSFVIIATRLIGRYLRTMRVYNDDWMMLATMIPLGIRLGLVHMVLIWGTNNVSLDGFEKFTIPNGDDEFIEWGLDEEIRRREKGSKLVLACRFAYVAFLWSQQFCITEFHRKLNLSIYNHVYRVGLVAIRWALVATYVAVMIATLAECNPFHKYWQVTPDPGPRCRQGAAPLIVTAVCNSLTNIAIVFFPLPPILMSQMKMKKKILLVISLSLSLLPAVLAIYRVPFVLGYNSAQPYRSLFSSFECLASCAVANGIVLNSFVRGKGPKKNKYRGPGDANMVYSPEQIAKRGRGGDTETSYALDVQSVRGGMRAAWGSDEDLVKDTGLGMAEELRKDTSITHIMGQHRQSAITDSSGASSEAVGMGNGSGGGQGWPPPWAQAWEEGEDSWGRRRSGDGSGRELVLPPPPRVALEPPRWKHNPVDPEDPEMGLEMWSLSKKKNDKSTSNFQENPKGTISDSEQTDRSRTRSISFRSDILP